MKRVLEKRPLNRCSSSSSSSSYDSDIQLLELAAKLTKRFFNMKREYGRKFKKNNFKQKKFYEWKDYVKNVIIKD